MRDVAEAAGVSIKTVSRVVNNQGEIREETRQRVLIAINKLGYRPSKVARALVTRRTDTIGLIFGDIANPYHAEVARGVLDTAKEENLEIFVCNTDGNPEAEKRALTSFLDHNVDGAIVFPIFANYEWIKKYIHPVLPLVLINCNMAPQPRLGIVNTNLSQGAKLAVDYLIEKGHRHIGMLAGDVAPKETIRRVQGYKASLEAKGLVYRDEIVLTGGPIIEFGFIGANQLLTEYPEITAIFCYNDLIAMGANQACKKLGKRVPQDCAILGYDDNKFSGFVNPALTTVHVDKYQIGAKAAKLMIDVMNNPEKEYSPIHLDVHLIIRESA
jgi:LacI family transcriptional regulator